MGQLLCAQRLRETQQDALSILVSMDVLTGFANLHEFSDQPADLPPDGLSRRWCHDMGQKLSALLGVEPICAVS
jgi:hypothetical protein